MSSGLRSKTTNGPPAPAAPRGVAANSSEAFFCAGVSLSAGMGGKRSWAKAETANTNSIVVLNSKFMGGVYQERRAHAGSCRRSENGMGTLLWDHEALQQHSLEWIYSCPSKRPRRKTPP